MCEEKPNEGSGLTQGECLILYATYKLLDCLQEAHFSNANIVRKRVLVLTASPGGLGYLMDIFTVLTDAIRMKERACIEQNLAALVEMLDEAGLPAESQTTEPGPPPLPWPWHLEDTIPYGQPPPLEEPAPQECETPRSNHGW